MKKEVTKKALLTLYLLILIIIIYFFIFYKLNNNEIYNNKLIGHAIYGIDNNDYTNSYESLELAYENDIKIIEVDFLLTSDKKLILNHYWEDNKVEDYNTFINKKIKDKYTPMDIDMLLEYMNTHKDIYVVVDTKEEDYSKDKLSIYSIIVNKSKKIDKRVLDRFIIQIYNYKDFRSIKKIYNFKNYIYTVYKLEKLSIYTITYYCLYNDINVIAVPKEYVGSNILDKRTINLIRNKNIKLYTYTINSKEEYQKLKELNIDGIYTDYLNNKDINGDKNE